LVAFEIVHPMRMLAFLLLTAVTFSLFGFIIGIWADGFEKLQLVPLLIVTPLTFLGGSFYSINMLPPVWRTITLANPVVYLVSGFRWSFYGQSDVSVGISLSMTMAFLILCLVAVWLIFKTSGLLAYRIFVCALGLVIAMLSVTGVYIWWKKRRAQKFSKAHRGQPAAATEIAAA
jgi:ABC-type multidrug transport system permease subunit